jgi:hypothetical protein
MRNCQSEAGGLWLIKLIKAVVAFERVIHRRYLRALQKEEVELLLMVLLRLIQRHEYSKLMKVFIRFVDCYHKDIEHHAF